MAKQTKIEGTTEAWESGELGRAEKYVGVAEGISDDLIDESLGLKMISIRLQESLIEELKMIAQLNGLGYQPLIRQVLKRFTVCEIKKMVRDIAAEESQKSQMPIDDPEHVMEKKQATG